MNMMTEMELKRIYSELKELCGRSGVGVLILVRSDGTGFIQNPEPNRDELPADAESPHTHI